MDKNELYRSIIVSRSSKPFNHVQIKPKGYLQSNANVASCQDDFDVYVNIDHVISDIKFSGAGCSISTSSLDMISEYLVGKTSNEAIEFIDNYRNMIKGKEFDASILKDLIAFENVSNHLNRIGCALIGANTIKGMLEGKYE